MSHLHLVVPDLFLAEELPHSVYAGLSIPALEKVLARAEPQKLAAETLEAWLCAAFGIADDAIAPIALRAEGVAPGNGYWLRADPAHLQLRHNELVLFPATPLTAEVAARLCADLNAHFSGDGLRFIAPHPERWYLWMERPLQMRTRPLSEVAGRDIRNSLPGGEEAMHGHRILNEAQMLLYDHPVNRVREARGEHPVNSVWLWGGGRDPGALAQPFTRVLTDSPLAVAFAAVANIGHAALPSDASACQATPEGATLVVWEGLRRAMYYGDVRAWRDALQDLEQNCVNPALRALRWGRIGKVTLDVLAAHRSMRYTLTRGMAWRFWRRVKRMEYIASETGKTGA